MTQSGTPIQRGIHRDKPAINEVRGLNNVPAKSSDVAHNKMVAPFEKLKDAAFDRRYAREMVVGHQKAIRNINRNRKTGATPRSRPTRRKLYPPLRSIFRPQRN
jgi:hypothetical protein